MRNPRPCLDCGVVVNTGDSRCPAHQLAYRARRTRRNYRGYRVVRAQLLRLFPVCSRCGGPGTQDDPLTVDHVVPRAWGGGDSPANLRPMHRSENSQRGAARW